MHDLVSVLKSIDTNSSSVTQMIVQFINFFAALAIDLFNSSDVVDFSKCNTHSHTEEVAIGTLIASQSTFHSKLGITLLIAFIAHEVVGITD